MCFLYRPTTRLDISALNISRSYYFLAGVIEIFIFSWVIFKISFQYHFKVPKRLFLFAQGNLVS